MRENKRKSTCALVGSGAPSAITSFGYPLEYNNNNYNNCDCQVLEFTEDKELKSQFTDKKLYNHILSKSYYRIAEASQGSNDINIYQNKSLRVRSCGSFLTFAHEINQDGEIAIKGKLHNANFCRDRLCPMCSWRRSFKIFGQVSQIMEQIGSEYQFLFLTLTVPNCKLQELSETLDKLFSAWNRFTGYKKIKKVVKGYFRALEVTYNKESDTFHPHFHIVLAVPLGYLSNSDYIKRDDWLSMWQKAYRDMSITQVDIRVCKSKYTQDELKAQSALASAVAEIAKYAVKSSDYLYSNDDTMTDRLVYFLSKGLCGRRLSQFGGIFKDTFKALKMEDVESEEVNLVHIDNEKLNPSLAWLICRYNWSLGAYQLVDSFVESAEEHLKS